MSAETAPSEPAQRQQDWLRRLADEYLKLEAAMPMENILPDDVPQWVQNVEREVGAAMYPAAKLKEELKLTPQRLGAIIGHQCAIAVWMMEWLVEESEKPQAVDDKELSPEQIKQGEEFIYKLTGDWYMALRRLAKRALASCVDQSYDDMKVFLLAYANAFARKPGNSDLGSFGNSAFEIYHFILFNWQMIGRLNSVHQLHQVLVKVFGSRAGDLKRTEKICQRIGLHYRKAGRPKKME